LVLLLLGGCATRRAPEQRGATVGPAAVAAPVRAPDIARAETDQPLPKPTPPALPGVDPAAAPVVERLAAQLLVEPEAVVVRSVVPATWPDACLGLAAEGEICASAQVPGYVVELSVGIDTYEFRTDATGEKIRLAAAPVVRAGEPLVTWKDARSFATMIIGTQRVAVGRRGRPMIAAPLAVPGRALELREFLARCAPFEEQTPAGEIALRGVGASRPDGVERRRIAEWARLVSLEARAGAAQPEEDVAITWIRSGQGGGFDLIEITRTGVATATHRREGVVLPVASVSLGLEELGRLYGWLDGWEAFEEAASEVGGAINLRGTGVEEAGAADRAEIRRWIDELALRLREAALRE